MAERGMTSDAPAGDDPSTGGEEGVAAALSALQRSGHGAEEVARRLLAPLATEAERSWAANEWSPGREQSASAVIDVVRALLVAAGDASPPVARVPVVAAAGEWHLLPARLAALFLRLQGWEAGAPAVLPLHCLARSLAEDGEARAVVVSCSMPMNLPGVARRVAVAHAAGLPVLTVGPGFGPGGAWARIVGADGWAPAMAAGEALHDLPSAPPFAPAQLPHPEVGELRAHRAQTVDAALARLLLVDTGPPHAGPSRHRVREHRRRLLGLARTLEAALFVGDDDVLLDHVRWSVATAGPGEEVPELIAAAVASLAAVVRAPGAARLLAEAEVGAAEALAARHRRPAPGAPDRPPDPPLPAPVGPGEVARLTALRRLGVLDSAPEARFDDLVRVAAAMCATPMAGLAFVDAERVWLKSALGDVAGEEPRSTSPAAWALVQREPLVVPDAAADHRFAAHAAVAGGPHVRFWAGAPVACDGHPLGALFVADVEPRRLGAQEYEALRALARQVGNLLDLRTHELDLDRSPAPVPPAGAGDERALLVRRLLADRGGPDKLLRTREVALLFDVSERTVNYWASQGRLPSRQTAGGHRRYASRDVLQLFQSSSQLMVEG